MDTAFPNNLYHYCSIPTFMSIIKNKCFWLTDCKYTNDKEEIRALQGAVRLALNELVSEKKINEEFADQIWKTYYYNTLTGYISCFSEKGDLLSQWRSYGCDGKGVAISVNFNKMNVAYGGPFRFPAPTKKYYAKKIMYVDDSIKSYIKDLLKNIIAAEPLTDGANYEKMFSLFYLSYFSKNHGFKEECEWRISYLPMIVFDEKGEVINDGICSIEDIKFYCKDDRMISYFELPIIDGSINEIVLGPKNNIDRNTLNMFLVTNGFRNVKISKSDIPFV